RDRYRSWGHPRLRRPVSARRAVSLRDHRGRCAESRRAGDGIPAPRAAGRRTAVALSAAPLTSRPYPGLRALLFLAAVALGWNLDGYRLLDPDEGRNAEVAREMAHTNDYLVPHLDGLPYLDKPIVYFAAAAALMELLGPTETAARLPAYAATLAIALPLLVLVPHALATGLPLRRLFSWRAVGAFALIALPWFIAVSIRVPAFPYYVVVRETLQRVTTGTFHRTAPFWYFFPIVP